MLASAAFPFGRRLWEPQVSGDFGGDGDEQVRGDGRGSLVCGMLQHQGHSSLPTGPQVTAGQLSPVTPDLCAKYPFAGDLM